MSGADCGHAGPGAQASTRYGGFHLAALDLALPMSALREVVPLGDLLTLPCNAHGVIGGIRLRGVAVPVVDLRQVLGLANPAPAPHPSVIIMVHAGSILGLLVDGVSGVFNGRPEAFNPVARHAAHTDPAAALMAGSLLRDDDQALVSVLSPAAVAALPGVPMVDDPEPNRQPAGGAGETGESGEPGEALQVDDPSLPTMLMRCGAIPMAIDAMAVHATLPCPQIDTQSVLAVGHCRGVIDYAGAAIPALDLLALCGLGRSAETGQGQAFVLQAGGGLVALLVDEVVDVVRIQADDVIRMPAFVLQRAALFAGTLATASLPAEVQARTQAAAGQYLLIDPAALRACPDVAGLAATNARSDIQPAGLAAGTPQAAQPDSGRCSMITYALGGETATPIAQVAEILPYQPEASIFGGAGGLLGMVVHRGRSIPVMCLSSLTGGPADAVSASASVLVVESAGEWVGFAVPLLKSIELADWQAEAAPAGPAASRKAANRSVLDTRRLARVGPAQAQRLLPVVDLQQLARSLQAGAA